MPDPAQQQRAAAKDSAMTEPITKANSREVQIYREMAESCRKMARACWLKKR
jgi:hypothetical protein